MNRWSRTGCGIVRTRWTPSARAPVPQSRTMTVPSDARTSTHEVLPPNTAVFAPGAAIDPRVPQNLTRMSDILIIPPRRGTARGPARRLARADRCAHNRALTRRTGTMTLPLIPSAVVGSHGKPGWWFAAVRALERGEFGDGDLEEMLDDAADTAIR